MLKIAAIVATPYQLFNILRIYGMHLKDDIEVDLYFQNLSETTDLLLGRVRETHIFNKIYTWHENMKMNHFEYHINQMICYSSSRLFAKTLQVSPAVSMENKYQYITWTFGNGMECLLARTNRNAKIVWVEDGTGTYTQENWFLPNTFWGDLIKRKIYNLKRIPVALYVNNKALCVKKSINNIVRIASVEEIEDKIYKKEINFIFIYDKAAIYSQHRIVWLTQPVHGYLDRISQDITCNIINKYKNDSVVRLHPWDDLPPHTVREVIQDKSGLWEVICEQEITSNHILIADLSTAQLTPKILYDKEPYLIFTYKLVAKIYPLDQCKQLCDEIKKQYKNKEKIIIVESKEELECVMGKLMLGTSL